MTAEIHAAQRSPEQLLAETALALHSQADRSALLAWAAIAVSEAADADDAAICTFEADDSTRWAARSASGSRFEDLGDPRHSLELQPAISEGRSAVLVGERVQLLLPDAPWTWVVALRVAPPGDTPQGILLVGGSSSTPPALDLINWLTTHLAVALENHDARSRLQASQRQIVHRLQESLLPPPPPLENTELGRFYIGAEAAMSTGGDLYDWLVLPDGSLHFSIVDVMGKGVSATKDAVSVTHVLRLLVLDGCPLADVVRRADSILTLQNPELVATGIVGRYDPDSGEVEMAGAGHPPALVLGQGSAEPLLAPGIPIGWPGAGSVGTVKVTLEDTGSLVLYTDGLVESTRDILEGLDALARHARQTAEYPAEHQARALVERSLEGAARYDDSLALVIKRRTPARTGVHPLGPFRHLLGASTASIPLARHLLSDWLRLQPVPEPILEDLLLAASELCTNAMRHGDSNGWTACLRASVDGIDVVLEVDDDDDASLDLSDVDEVPDTDALSGRGLFLVSALTDDIEVITNEQGKTIRARKRNAVSASPGRR